MVRVLLAALLLWALPSRAANYTDLWWNKDESGWGLTLAHHNDKVFAVWYVYDADRKPFWLVMPGGTSSAEGRTYSGTLYRTTGPTYRDSLFQPSRVSVTPVGSARIDFEASETSARRWPIR